jgi:DNA-binding CsgD family transcriptional regulator
MTWIKTFWRWINPADPIRLILLKLGPVHAQYLSQLAENTGASRQKVAEDLLKNALIDRQVAETHLERWRALTPRQQQVAALTCLNFTNRQIAARLGISPQTVKSHMRNLLHHFTLHSKEELRLALADWDFSEWTQD